MATNDTPIRPHDLRRTAGTWAAVAGVDLNRIAEMMGHNSVSTTRRVYAKYQPDYLLDVVAAIESAPIVPQTANAERTP